MCRLRLTRNGIDRLFALVDDNVHDIGKASALGRPKHILMDGIFVENAGSRSRMRDELSAMVGKNRLLACYTRKHALASARESRKEMRLDKALSQKEIGLGGKAVDQQLSARRQPSE